MRRSSLIPVTVALLVLAGAGCSGQPAPGGGGGKPTIGSFRAEPAAIAPGEASTLSWQVSGATNLALEPAIGPVTGASQPVRPDRTTEYTLTASNAAGSASASTTVTVATGGGGAEPLHDTIAYARADGDEIRLVNPDGTGDRRLWAHGLDDPKDAYEVWSTSWSPDATTLAFASTHETWCSFFRADVFTIGADGGGYRRVTQAPSCPGLTDFPKGTVRVPVRNPSFDTFSGFLYVQGAPTLQTVSLPPGGSTVVVFEDVADFGDGEGWLQFAAVVHPAGRAALLETLVDVQDGADVTTGAVDLFVPDSVWEARSPTWNRDGSALGFVLDPGRILRVSPEPGPLEFGAPLLGDDVHPSAFVHRLAWGPTPDTADRLLYLGSAPFGDLSIYLAKVGVASEGEVLLSFSFNEFVLGLAWLPDGSGFVFSVTEGDYFGEDRSANLFVYDFASGESTRVTSFVGDFAGQVTVSGDGRHFAFERSADLDQTTGAMVAPDLWLVDRDGGGLRLLVEAAYAPSWSW